MSGLRGLVPRVGVALLLVGFLAHAGDGLVTAFCHTGQEDSGRLDMASGHAQGSHSVDHAGEEPSGGMPCPFGSGAVAPCAGAAPAFSTEPLVRTPLTATVSSVRSEPDHTPGILLASGLFRPPRA